MFNILTKCFGHSFDKAHALPDDERSAANASVSADSSSTGSSARNALDSKIVNKPGTSVQRKILKQLAHQEENALIQENSTDSDSSGPIGPSRPRLRMKKPFRPAETPFLTYDRWSSPMEVDVAWRFRSTNDLSALDASINKKGLEDLFLSGSASFTSRKQVEHIHHVAQGRKVIVVDLRQESHAIVNNEYPVTRMVSHDWDNVRKSYDEVLSDEADLISGLSEQSEVTLLRYQDLKKNITPPHSVTIKNPRALSEQELVESTGATYVRLTNTEHVRLRREDIDRFIKVLQSKPDDGWLHVHCKGGKTRTTTAMVMYDMLRNAKDVPIEDIIHRQKALGPGTDLFNMGDRVKYRDFFQDRKDFLLEFYEYAKANPMGYPQSWSEWRSS